MGLFKRGLIKAGMIVGSIFAAGAAVGAAAKSAYKKKRNSYENKYEAKDTTYTYAKPSDGTCSVFLRLERRSSFPNMDLETS